MAPKSDPVSRRSSTSNSTPLVLGVDASTTAVKCLLFDSIGRTCSQGRADLELINPEPLGYEQNAESWWTATVEAIRQAIGGIASDRLVSICIAHQRETVVVTDSEGRPLVPALVWMDERCRAEVEETAKECDPDRIHRVSGKPVCTTPSLYKLLWLRKRRPNLFEGDIKVLDVHAFLVHRLTGRFVTSVACADPMGLMDLERSDWSDRLLDLVQLDRRHVAELTPVGSLIGPIAEDAAAQTGLPAGLPLIAGLGDGQAAGLGAGIAAIGPAYLNLGTALVSGIHSTIYRVDPAFRTMAGAIPGTFFLETDLKGGAFTINWLLDKWFPWEDSAEKRRRRLAALEREAASLPPGAEGLLLVPYWCSVMNPYWDDTASGLVVGWRGHHGPAHLYRAILEGLALEQRLHGEAVERATGQKISEYVAVGGGAASDLWCQMVADTTKRPVRRAATTEASALGAGILAAFGAGLHVGLKATVSAMTSAGRCFVPQAPAVAYDRLFEEVYRHLYPANKEAMKTLATLTRGAC